VIRRFSLIVFVMFSSLVHGQVISKVTFEKDTVKIGELNTLTIEITTPRTGWVKSYDLGSWLNLKPTQSFYANDSIDLASDAEFDFIDIDPSRKVQVNSSNFEQAANGQYVHKNSTRFIAWDIGVFDFLDPVLTLDTIESLNTINLRIDPLVVMPPTEFVMEDTTQIIAPLMPILKEDKSWRDWIWMVYLLVALLILAGIAYYFWKRSQVVEEVVEEEVIRPAHEVALEKLSGLQRKKLWQEGKVKEYQSELTRTIREYLENRFGIQALESTTSEINRSLKSVDFDPRQTQKLNNILQVADLVKFAKANPQESIHEEFMNHARTFVEETKGGNHVNNELELLNTLDSEEE